MKKTKGVIDPMTLGLLLSIIGAVTGHLLHKNDVAVTKQPEHETDTTKSVEIVPTESEIIERSPE